MNSAGLTAELDQKTVLPSPKESVRNGTVFQRLTESPQVITRYTGTDSACSLFLERLFPVQESNILR